MTESWESQPYKKYVITNCGGFSFTFGDAKGLKNELGIFKSESEIEAIELDIYGKNT